MSCMYYAFYNIEVISDKIEVVNLKQERERGSLGRDSEAVIRLKLRLEDRLEASL